MLLILKTEDCLDGIQDKFRTPRILCTTCALHSANTLPFFGAVGKQSQSLKEAPPMAMRHLTWAVSSIKTLPQILMTDEGATMGCQNHNVLLNPHRRRCLGWFDLLTSSLLNDC